ncbi:hypothetical protein [Nocardia sp. XZ_19_385]|uniref:hypothetical protein n=1 Tax=Nocardia sp. XZ_19_385 TaxID=2769488 RepID=UPI00188F1CA4|nr:hypothetical protein [Nocardia sp. XZ_19_385]
MSELDSPPVPAVLLADDPVATTLPTQLHQLRAAGHPVTITARGGHTLTGIHIDAVRRRHAVLTAGDRPPVLMPLAFIDTASAGPAAAALASVLGSGRW